MTTLLIVLFIIILTLIFKRSLSRFVYVVVIIDIFFRVLTYIKVNLLKGLLYSFIDSYIPNSVYDLFSSYTSGFFEILVSWLIIVIYMVFEFYIIKAFFRKK